MPVNIKTVSSKKEMTSFKRLPDSIYKSNANWVKPLNMENDKLLNTKKNPFFKHSQAEFFIAYNNEHQPVGRIAAIKNNIHLDIHQDDAGFFGFFECTNNQEVATALLEAAAGWLKEHGLKQMRGPISFSVHDYTGLLVEGFGLPPSISMSYNPEYYSLLLTQSGLRAEKELVSYMMDFDAVDETKGNPAAVLAIIKKRSSRIHVRSLNVHKLPDEIKIFNRIYNEAWKDNWCALPLDEKEFLAQVKSYKALMDPDIIYVAEHNGVPAGILFAMPDYNQIFKKLNGRLLPLGFLRILFGKRRIDKHRVLLFGVLPEFHKLGVELCLMEKLFRSSQKKHYRYGEFSWILADNHPMCSILDKIGAVLDKRYRVYIRSI